MWANTLNDASKKDVMKMLRHITALHIRGIDRLPKAMPMDNVKQAKSITKKNSRADEDAMYS